MARLTLECLFLLLGLVVAQWTLSTCQTVQILPAGVQMRALKTGYILTCQISQYSPDGAQPIMFWQAPDGSTVTAQSGRVFVERTSPTVFRLYITEVLASDAGLYSCKTLIDGDSHTADTRLEIFEDVAFRPSPDSVKTKLGESPLLQCSARGRPQPAISWRFNRQSIISDGVKFQFEARGLRIYNLDENDGGVYECRAEVASAGIVKTKEITLDVQYPPKFTVIPPKSLVLLKDSRAEIKCVGSGNPDISYQWFMEHKSSPFAMVKVTLTETSDTFVFEKVSESDARRYFCRISNRFGHYEAYTDVSVVAASKVADIPNETLLENSVLMLTCRVEGDPEPTIQWHREGNSHPYVDGVQPLDSRVKVDNSQPGVSKLVIHDIKRTYSGQYRCAAYNKAGNDSKTTNVSVEFGPTITSIDESKYGWPGEVRNFTCSGFGKPLPSLNWLKDSTYISNNEIYTVFTETDDVVTSTLQIKIKEGEPWVFGKYSCFAKNIYNYVPSDVELIEATVPGKVANATLVDETSDTVVLKAGLPKDHGNMPLTQWKVQYQAAKGEGGESEEHTLYFDLVEDLTVTGLESGILYTIYLSVGNIVGFSDPIVFEVRTREEEQADLPIMELPPDTNIHRTGATLKESQNYKGKMKEVRSESSDSEPVMSQAVTVVVGVTVSLAVIVLIIVSVAIYMRRKARKEDDYTKTWKGMFNNGTRKPTLSDHEGTMVKISESRDIDQMQLEIRRVDGSQPDLIAHPSPKPSRDVHEKCRSPFEIRKNNGKVPQLNSPGSVDTLQQRAWDQMLMKQAMQEDEANQAEQEHEGLEPPKPDELTPMMDLPPPPAFLLDENTQNASLNADNISYHDILDGYHSEENIDDGESYQIRVPYPEPGHTTRTQPQPPKRYC